MTSNWLTFALMLCAASSCGCSPHDVRSVEGAELRLWMPPEAAAVRPLRWYQDGSGDGFFQKDVSDLEDLTRSLLRFAEGAQWMVIWTGSWQSVQIQGVVDQDREGRVVLRETRMWTGEWSAGSGLAIEYRLRASRARGVEGALWSVQGYATVVPPS